VSGPGIIAADNSATPTDSTVDDVYRLTAGKMPGTYAKQVVYRLVTKTGYHIGLLAGDTHVGLAGWDSYPRPFE